MEQVLLNPGFYHITKKILQNLDDESVKSLSKTNKNFLSVCYNFLIEKPQNISYLESKMDDPCHMLRDFFTFLRQNRIHHEIFFKYPWGTRSQNSKELLDAFIQKLTDLCVYNDQRYSRRRSRIIEKFMRFMPSSCPPASKMNLMELLSYVLRKSKPDLDLVKQLLAATKDFDTCVRKVIYLLKNDDEQRSLNHKSAIEIAIQCCKSPNMPDKFENTAIHLASEFNYLDIIVDLIPYCNSLDIKNEKGENVLASVVEKLYFMKEHTEIVKLMIVMSEKHKVANIYKTMPTCLVAKSIIFRIIHLIITPSRDVFLSLIGLLVWLYPIIKPRIIIRILICLFLLFGVLIFNAFYVLFMLPIMLPIIVLIWLQQIISKLID